MEKLKECKTCKVEKYLSKFDLKNKSCKACVKARYLKKLKQKRPEALIFAKAKERAIKFNYEFTIELEDIVIPKVCPIIGIELYHTAKVRADNTPSLDRKDNSKGYVKGNVFVISDLANRIKSNMSKEFWITFSIGINEYLK